MAILPQNGAVASWRQFMFLLLFGWYLGNKAKKPTKNEKAKCVNYRNNAHNYVRPHWYYLKTFVS